MTNIRLKIQYDGTDYSGWQIQPSDKTIEGEITVAIGQIFQREVKLIGASRTDAGVHARGQIANFNIDRNVDVQTLRRGLNAILPHDISIQTAEEVNKDFHSRYNSKGKVYNYFIWNRDYKTPFYNRYSWHYHPPLDIAEMNRCALFLKGEKDFSSFRASGCDSSSPIRRIDLFTIKREDGFIKFVVEGSAFMKQMVRNIVGTLVQVGIGKMKPEQIIEILEARDRRTAGPTAPAQGLVLVSVKY